MKRTEAGLSYKNIFIFWYPLAATWIMMALEQPFINAVIARLGLPKYNLAAFGVAFSFAVFIESPIIMLMSASTALVKTRNDYYKMLRFSMTFRISTISSAVPGVNGNLGIPAL